MRVYGIASLLLVGVHGLLQWNAKLLAYRLELLEVFVILALVLNLELDAWDRVSMLILVSGE